MAENTPQGPNRPINPNANPGEPAPVTPPKKKRRFLWLKILGVLVVLLVALIALAPTILSTAPARGLVLGQVNNQLNGRVEMANWSLSWTGPIEISGLRVYDAQNAVILELRKLHTPLSPLAAARGNLDLGTTVVDGLNVVQFHQEKNGQNTFTRLLKPTAKTEPSKPSASTTSAQPAKLPDIKGTIQVTDLRATVTAEGVPQPLYLDPSSATITITSINAPIKQDVSLAYRVGSSQTPGTIKLAGEVDAIENGQVDIQKLVAKESLQLANVDLAALSPFLQMANLKLATAGVLNGQLNLSANTLRDLSVAGQIQGANISAGGELLQGDTFATKTLNIPIAVSTKAANGGTQVVVQTLKIEMDQGAVSVTADAPLESLVAAGQLVPAAIQQSLLGQKQAQTSVDWRGGTGQAVVNADFDVAALANQLKNLARLQQGTTLSSGKLAHKTTLDLTNDKATIATNTDITQVAGTVKLDANTPPRNVSVEPIHLGAFINVIPGPNPDLRDLKLELTSGFATLNGGGPSLAKMDLAGNMDLAKLQSQAQQLVNLNELLKSQTPVNLKGAAKFALNTEGNPTQADAPLQTKANLTLNDVVVSGLSPKGDFAQKWLALDYSGTVKRSGSAVAGIDNAAVALKSGNPNQPTVDLYATANVALSPKLNVPAFKLERLIAPSLPQVQQDYAAFFPKDFALTAGSLAMSAAGSFDGTTLKLEQPANLAAQHLTVERVEKDRRTPLLQDESITATLAGTVGLGQDLTSVDLSQLLVTTSSNLLRLEKAADRPLAVKLNKRGGFSGDGAVTLGADLVRANQLAAAFSGKLLAVGPNGEKLDSGLLGAGIAFTHPANETRTSLAANLKLSQLTVGRAINNETVDVTLNAIAPDDFSAVQNLAATVQSTFANVAVKDGQILLLSGQGPQAKPAGVWEMVQNLSADVTLPDLPKLQAFANALTPAPTAPAPVANAAAPPAAPTPPLQLTKGSAALTLNVKREQGVTRLVVPEIRGTDIAFTRGEGAFNLDAVNLKLVAAVEASDDGSGQKPLLDQIKQVTVTELAGNVGGGQSALAVLSMPKPIHLTNLATSPQAEGSIGVQGSLERVSRLVEAMGGQKVGSMPYSGSFALQQDIGTRDRDITLAGGLTIRQLQVSSPDETGRQRVAFSDDNVELKNQLVVNPQQKTAIIQNLDLAMKGSGAAKMNLTGAIADWEKQRRITQDLTIVLSYDLPKVWAIVEPMLAAETREQVKGLVLEGKYDDRRFFFAGSFPADQPFEQAIKQLRGGGGVAVTTIDLPAKGIVVKNLVLPFGLENGVATLHFPNQPKGQDMPPLAYFNEGQLNLGGAVLDLGQIHPRLTLPPNHQLLKGAKLNPVFSKSVMGDFLNNPLFAESGNKPATGLMDVLIVQCQALPVDAYMKDPRSDGVLDLKYSISEVDIGATWLVKLASLMKKNMISQDAIRGSIKDGTVSIQGGQVQHYTPLLVDKYPLVLSGGVNLQTSIMERMNIVLPAALFEEKYQRFVGNGVTIPFKGSAKSPMPDFDFGAFLVEAGKSAIIGQILPQDGKEGGKSNPLQDILGGGERNKAQPANPPSGNAPATQPKKEEDPIGGLIDLFNRDKNKDRNKKK